MAKVPLDFLPPTAPDITKLHIYEATVKTGPFVEIELVTAVGTYPTYISHYVTSNATLALNWFAIAWEDAAGAVSDMSSPIKGGTDTVVEQVVTRMLQRDSTISLAIAVQEAEALVQTYFGVDDPYDPALKATYTQLNGLTYLAMARSYIFSVIKSGNVEKATMGLVSFQTSTGSTKTVDIQALIDLANLTLGIGTSIILQMAEICRAPYYILAMEP